MVSRIPARILLPAAALLAVIARRPAWLRHSLLDSEQIAEDYARSGAEFEPRYVIPEGIRQRPTLDQIVLFRSLPHAVRLSRTRCSSRAGATTADMIEGESGSDHNIIQTDNTQEAIRVWSQYADLDRRHAQPTPPISAWPKATAAAFPRGAKKAAATMPRTTAAGASKPSANTDRRTTTLRGRGTPTVAHCGWLIIPSPSIPIVRLRWPT